MVLNHNNYCTTGLDLFPQEIDLNDIAHKAVLDLLKAVHAKSNTIMISVVGGHQTINFDPMPLSMIINVLISNAIHHTEHGAIILRIATYPDRFVLDVVDSGTGILPHLIPDLFSSSADVTNDFMNGRPPIGFSLKVVNELVSMLDGKMTVESHHKIGSMFQVTLPLIEVPFMTKALF